MKLIKLLLLNIIIVFNVDSNPWNRLVLKVTDARLFFAINKLRCLNNQYSAIDDIALKRAWAKRHISWNEYPMLEQIRITEDKIILLLDKRDSLDKRLK